MMMATMSVAWAFASVAAAVAAAAEVWRIRQTDSPD